MDVRSRPSYEGESAAGEYEKGVATPREGDDAEEGLRERILLESDISACATRSGFDVEETSTAAARG